MAQNRGKQWESKLREDFSKLPEVFIYRVPDVMNGFKGASGICDFIGYAYPSVFFLEAKTVIGNVFPLSNFTQYDKLMSVPDIKGVHRGVVIWFQSHDKVIYVPVVTIDKMLKDGKKSINIKTISTNEYEYVEIPSVKKRVFLDSDYSILLTLPEQGW